MTIWFTSDHHFGHENIIKYCDRPFNSVGHMNAAMIEAWNGAVAPGDTVSDFVVAAALNQASQVIEQQMVLKLCLEDSMALAEAFLTEPEPNKKAIEAAMHYRARMGHA